MSSTASTSGNAPPMKNKPRQPYSGITAPANRPANMPPSGTQTMVAVTATVRCLAGVNSAVMVVELGNAPPMPKPAIRRRMAMVSTSGARPMAQVAAPKISTLPMMAQRRPKRSANKPAQALPRPIPIRPAATAGAKALRVMPHSLISTGIAKPINWPSKPSMTMDSAARQTTNFCIVVKTPSSRVLPMSMAALMRRSLVWQIRRRRRVLPLCVAAWPRLLGFLVAVFIGIFTHRARWRRRQFCAAKYGRGGTDLELPFGVKGITAMHDLPAYASGGRQGRRNRQAGQVQRCRARMRGKIALVIGDEVGCRHGLGVEPALHELDLVLAQVVGLLLGFDAFGDDLQLERLGHAEDVGRHAAGGGIGADGVDEGFIDLECIQRQALQVGQAGVTGTEVVDGHGIAHRTGARQGDARRVDVHEAALGGFQPDLLRFDAGVLQRRLHRTQRAAGLDVVGAEVDGDVQVAVTGQQLLEVVHHLGDDLVGDR